MTQRPEKLQNNFLPLCEDWRNYKLRNFPSDLGIFPPTRRVSSVVEQLICNHQVVGSSPTLGFSFHSRVGKPWRGDFAILDRRLESWETGCMKRTLDLPDDLLRELKVAALQEGKTLRALIAEKFRAALGTSPQVESNAKKKQP